MANKGGKREGAGRKAGVSNLIKKTLQDKITPADVTLALKTLRDAMKCDNWKAKIEAAEYLLDQKFGKASQSVDLTSDGEGIFDSVIVSVETNAKESIKT